MGIVSHVCPDDELMAAALALADRIASQSQSPIAVSMVKRTVYQSL